MQSYDDILTPAPTAHLLPPPLHPAGLNRVPHDDAGPGCTGYDCIRC
jgi:hypothetical protein